MPHEAMLDINHCMACVLADSSVREFKWSKLRQARERFAALKLIDSTIRFALDGALRVDVLVWDTHDSRHSVKGRDDAANLARMYYHLFKNVLLRRWPSGATWLLCPDENSALEWSELRNYLADAGTSLQIKRDLFDEGTETLLISLFNKYRISQIIEVDSCSTPLCQVADLFAGVGPYSYAAFDRYKIWLAEGSGQIPLELEIPGATLPPAISATDCERFLVLNHLDKTCKRHKLTVGLDSSRGLRTYDPRNPINFWLYGPQSPEDQAPLRSSA